MSQPRTLVVPRPGTVWRRLRSVIDPGYLLLAAWLTLSLAAALVICLPVLPTASAASTHPDTSSSAHPTVLVQLAAHQINRPSVRSDRSSASHTGSCATTKPSGRPNQPQSSRPHPITHVALPFSPPPTWPTATRLTPVHDNRHDHHLGRHEQRSSSAPTSTTSTVSVVAPPPASSTTISSEPAAISTSSSTVPAPVTSTQAAVSPPTDRATLPPSPTVPVS